MRSFGALGVLLLFWLSAALAQTDALQRAAALINEGRPQAALELLATLEARDSANAEYHYLVGIAELDSGYAVRAAASLKRAIELRPDLAQAHAELGRAYARIGAYKTAREELERAKRSNPPPEAVARIDRYLSEIAVAEAARDAKRWTGYVDAGVGYDSNVNFATSRQEITVPFFGGSLIAELAPTSRKLADAYATAGAGVLYRQPLQDGMQLRASAAAAGKFDRRYTQFDYGTLDLSGGLRVDRGEHQFNVALLHNQLTIDDGRVRDTNGLVADWRNVIHQNLELVLFAQGTRLTYPRDRQRDADRIVVGAGVLPALAGNRMENAPTLVTIYTGQERERNQGVAHFGLKLYGARLGYYLSLGGRALLITSAGYEHRGYGGADPFFGVTREDRQLDASAGVLYPLTEQWSLLPALAWTENRSNIDVFAYRRTTASVTARYSF